MSGRLRLALLALGFAVVGPIGLIAVFDGADTYRDIARARGVDGAVFHADPDLEWHIDLGGLVDLHQRTLAYVLGDAPQLPAFASTGRPLFDDNERSHLADVRAVFQATKLAFVAGVLIVVGTLRWTDRPQRPSLVRDAAIVAGVGVAALAVAATLSFEAVFQLFHEVFFPQGNFLFPPSSNLLILYPEPYWYGVTLRIGAACIVLMAIVALAATATLRRARR